MRLNECVWGEEQKGRRKVGPKLAKGKKTGLYRRKKRVFEMGVGWCMNRTTGRKGGRGKNKAGRKGKQVKRKTIHS